MSVNSANPATLFGGTWSRIKDTFLLASGDSYASGAMGGEATHTLTTAELPSHNHGLNNHTHSIPKLSGTAASNGSHYHSTVEQKRMINGSSTGGGFTIPTISTSGSSGNIITSTDGAHTHTVSTNASTTGGNTGNTANTGSGNAHNNMPPYLAVNIWQRTA